MENEIKVYTQQVVQEEPFPYEQATDIVSTSPSGQVYSPTEIKENSFPIKRIAVELLSAELNTRSRKILGTFELAESGGLQIGKYKQGDSGDIRITPNGITARDQLGNNTFVLDGDTGDATFAGTIQTGAIVAGRVAVGNNNVIIDGDAKAIIINDGTFDRILLGFQQGGF